MSEKKSLTSRICGHDGEQINIRGFSLTNELMGKLSFTEMLLLHFLGEKPSSMQVAILDSVLVGVMEHGITPSVISARQTLLGAPESFQGAVASGLLGVGDHFAGTCSKCAILLQDAVEHDAPLKEGARHVVQSYKDSGEKIPGYGHPSFKGGDPRTVKLFEIARKSGASGVYIDAVYVIADTIQELYGKALVPNVSAAIGAVLLEASIPINVMRGVVLVARCGGLVGHVSEEQSNPIAGELWLNADKSVGYLKS